MYERLVCGPLSTPAGIVMMLGALLYAAGELSQHNMWGPRWWRHHGSDFGFPLGFAFYVAAMWRVSPATSLVAGYAFFWFCELMQNFGTTGSRFDWADVLAASLSTLFVAVLIRREEAERLRTP